jgi:ATP-dependent 26S proteasome regulatory subunit
MRPGRFDCLVEVLPAQNEEDLVEVLKVCTRKMPLDDGVLDYAAKNIPLGSSGAVIDNICREAALCALYSGLDKITQKDFEQAISRNRV